VDTESKAMRSSVPRAASTSLLVLAAALGAFALLFIFGERLDVVAQADLEILHGTVFRVETRGTAKVSPKINIYLQDGARVIHLTQDDISDSLRSLQPHEDVTAWAKKDSLGRGMFWLWQLDRGTDRLLNYEETLAHETDGWRQLRIVGIAFALMAAVSGMLGIKRKLRT